MNNLRGLFHDNEDFSPAKEEDHDKYLAKIRGILQPRVTFEQIESGRSDPFVVELATVLEWVVAHPRGVSLPNRHFIQRDNTFAWAVAIAQYVPAPVQQMMLSGVADPTVLEWAETRDISVYWIGLMPLLEGHHWHSYVGSATDFISGGL